MEVLVHRHHQDEAAPYNKEGFSIPYFATEKDDKRRAIQIHPYPRENKRVFKFYKSHSIRHRGRRSTHPITSLASKLGRFKVRFVVAQDPPNDNR